jgi:polygalacturonase
VKIKKMKHFVFFLIFVSVPMFNAYAVDVSIIDFGARTDLGNNSEAIQKAMDHCSATGGRISQFS